MKAVIRAAAACLNCLVDDPALKTATEYLRATLVVKASAQVFKGKRASARDRRESFVVTVGKPNYDERAFLKKCKQAGEPIPVKKVQLKPITRRKE